MTFKDGFALGVVFCGFVLYPLAKWIVQTLLSAVLRS